MIEDAYPKITNLIEATTNWHGNINLIFKNKIIK